MPIEIATVASTQVASFTNTLAMAAIIITAPMMDVLHPLVTFARLRYFNFFWFNGEQPVLGDCSFSLGHPSIQILNPDIGSRFRLKECFDI